MIIYEKGEPRRNNIGRENPKNTEDTFHNITSSATNPIWTDSGANTGLSYERSATVIEANFISILITFKL
jgi:hypothetical protein